jgi:membrane fusion protein (multidrug efflux system)
VAGRGTHSGGRAGVWLRGTAIGATRSASDLAIVPLDSVWVDANFKENQLGSLRIGQPVQVSADMYGSHVQYHAKVLGLSAGTGSSLAVLPAQNASGNWIKIVQRLPVRIGLDPNELKQHPLFLGLSTAVEVDVHDQSGAPVSRQPVWQPSLNTDAYASQDAGADAEINAIVANNLMMGAVKMSAALPGVPRISALSAMKNP